MGKFCEHVNMVQPYTVNTISQLVNILEGLFVILSISFID